MGEPLTELHAFYRGLLDLHGVTHQGVGWADRRTPAEGREAFEAHANAILDVRRRKGPCTMLDFGCGWGALQDLIFERSLPIDYTGLDISETAIAAARERFPYGRFICSDIRVDGAPGVYDYAVANGVFACRRGVNHEDFLDFMHDTVLDLFEATRVGVAWNVLSSHVDYETDDWLHVPFDAMAEFVQTLTRSYTFRADYRWPSYTVYAYHE